MKKINVDNETLVFDEDEHRYLHDNSEVPGVTTITGIVDKSAPLMWWAVGEAKSYIEENFEDHIDKDNPFDGGAIEELADQARTAHTRTSKKSMKIGDLVHEYAEDYVQFMIGNDEEPVFPDNEKAQESCIEFLDWLEKNSVDPHKTEQMIFNPYERYAGTYDLKAEVDGELLIIDYKTSSGIYDTHYAQTAAYYVGEKVRTGEELDGFGIVRFPKDAIGFEVEIITDQEEIDHHYDGFLGCKEVYNWQKKL